MVEKKLFVMCSGHLPLGMGPSGVPRQSFNFLGKCLLSNQQMSDQQMVGLLQTLGSLFPQRPFELPITLLTCHSGILGMLLRTI